MENLELIKKSLIYETFTDGKCETRNDLSIRYAGVIVLHFLI